MGWTVRGSNRGGGEIFRTCPDRPWGPPSLPHNGYRVFPRGEVAGAWRWLPTTSRAVVKERVELYLFSPIGSSWAVIGWTFLLYSYKNYTRANSGTCQQNRCLKKSGEYQAREVLAWLQVFAAMSMRSSFLWDVTQRLLVVKVSTFRDNHSVRAFVSL